MPCHANQAQVSGEMKCRCNEKCMMPYDGASTKASVELMYSFDASPCRCPCKCGEKIRELLLGIR